MSSRATRLRSDKHAENIKKRGNVSVGSVEKREKPAISPMLVGFFIFVVIGSSILQIISTMFAKKHEANRPSHVAGPCSGSGRAGSGPHIPAAGGSAASSSPVAGPTTAAWRKWVQLSRLH
eukprot:CAMPEP_0182559304 /NCGR_PEP_ID=MMETSP1324-20130603/2482_1 /TAXON_ID=236786 /ORGANISM="Florenciella sp., Strain RCC1587" /LENGTH=120 /DNA_ID=CAMNT_0024771549 /DNA_START=47 /DNA_END=407 /DNA_ORIENTATION=-